MLDVTNQDISTKPFDDLLYYPTTLGMEASPDSRRSALDPEGLCVSAAHSLSEMHVHVFINLCLERNHHIPTQLLIHRSVARLL